MQNGCGTENARQKGKKRTWISGWARGGHKFFRLPVKGFAKTSDTYCKKRKNNEN